MKKNYDKLISDKQPLDGIPKKKLLVKLKEGLDEDRREFISNSIRAHFGSPMTLLLDLKKSQA